MTTIASQITSLMVVYSTVYSDADQRKYQSSASLAFVWGIHWDRWIPRTEGQLRRKCFHLMTSSCQTPWRYLHGALTHWGPVLHVCSKAELRCFFVVTRLSCWNNTRVASHLRLSCNVTNERGDVSDHRRLDYLLNRLFRRRYKKTSKLRVTGLCDGNPVLSLRRATNAENVSIWWRHHAGGWLIVFISGSSPL